MRARLDCLDVNLDVEYLTAGMLSILLVDTP